MKNFRSRSHSRSRSCSCTRSRTRSHSCSHSHSHSLALTSSLARSHSLALTLSLSLSCSCSLLLLLSLFSSLFFLHHRGGGNGNWNIIITQTTLEKKQICIRMSKFKSEKHACIAADIVDAFLGRGFQTRRGIHSYTKKEREHVCTVYKLKTKMNEKIKKNMDSDSSKKRKRTGPLNDKIRLVLLPSPHLPQSRGGSCLYNTNDCTSTYFLSSSRLVRSRTLVLSVSTCFLSFSSLCR